MYPVINDGETVEWEESILDPGILDKFQAVYIKTLDGDDMYQFNLSQVPLFYPIKQNDLDRNSRLEQTKGWANGSFDPLE